MTQFKILKGNKSDLGNATFVDGQVLITKDTGDIYVDIETDRIQLNANMANILRDADTNVEKKTATNVPVYFNAGAPVECTDMLWTSDNSEEDAATGEIKTIYSNNEKTNPVFPRTKINAVSDSDGTSLGVILNEKLSKVLTFDCYGDELPETGVEGQIFFKKVKDTGEWENPPMVLDIEYLTKEKWQNKSVYTKLVDFGTLPNATRKSVAHNTGATRILRLAGSTSSGTMLPTYYDTNDRIEIYANKTNIYITTVTDASAQTAVVQLWYIKD